MNDYGSVTSDVVDALRSICGEHGVLERGAAGFDKYSHDQVTDRRYGHPPSIVAKPADAAQVSAIMALATQERLPVTPRGAGSGLSGGAVPLHGGICLSCERMNRVLDIDPASMMVVAEPGVVTRELDDALAPHGLFFAGYPMSEEFCMIGGNVAENAGGGRAIKYGVVSRYVTGLEIVRADGRIVQLGGKRAKDVTGYDLVKLLCGSEGTLAVITKVFLQVMPRPRYRMTALARFASVEAAMATVPTVMTGGGFLPSSIEFMDRLSTMETCKSLKLPLPHDRVQATMLYEVDGHHEASVRSEAAFVRKACAEQGALDVQTGDDEEGSEPFWRFRKRVPWVINRLASHTSVEDIVVPTSAIPTLLSRLPELESRYDVRIPVFGHAGDGNLHAVPAAGSEADDRWDTMLPQLLTELYRVTTELGGAISGEHGIGHKRRRYVDELCDPVYVELMQGIKRAWDPLNILNPGKIFSLQTSYSCLFCKRKAPHGS